MHSQVFEDNNTSNTNTPSKNSSNKCIFKKNTFCINTLNISNSNDNTYKINTFGTSIFCKKSPNISNFGTSNSTSSTFKINIPSIYTPNLNTLSHSIFSNFGTIRTNNHII